MRVVPLDVLRGVAILLVLLAHTPVSVKESGALAPGLGYLRYLGPSGVDLFFVLSGFLIGGLLFRELHDRGSLDLRRFLVRRGFKIWPAYGVFIGYLAVRLTVVDGKSPRLAVYELAPNLLHAQNYLWSPREHTWSLAVEEHFYVALPLLLIVLARRRVRERSAMDLVPLFAVVLAVVCAGLRAHAYRVPQGFNPHFATHLRIDSLFLGVALAYLYRFKPDRFEALRRHRLVLYGGALVALLVYPLLVRLDVRNVIVGPLGATILALAYGAVVVAAVPSPIPDRARRGSVEPRTARSVAATAFIGFYSYPIYLWHREVGPPFRALFDAGVLQSVPPSLRWLGVFALYVGAATLAGMLLGRLVDRPALALRDRLFPPRAPGWQHSLAPTPSAALLNRTSPT